MDHKLRKWGQLKQLCKLKVVESKVKKLVDDLCTSRYNIRYITFVAYKYSATSLSCLKQWMNIDKKHKALISSFTSCYLLLPIESLIHFFFPNKKKIVITLGKQWVKIEAIARGTIITFVSSSIPWGIKSIFLLVCSFKSVTFSKDDRITRYVQVKL